MSKASRTSFMVLGAALAACSDGDAHRTPTAPGAGPALSEAPGDLGFGVTADGPRDVYLAPADADAPHAAAPMAAAPQAATAGRASGHVGFTFNPPAVGLATERYSFAARSTDAPTFAARGEFELLLSTPTGFENKVHGDVICMSTVGNVARLAGQITKVWVNNVQRPITGATHVIWTVTDNGEGQGAADTASPMFFNNAANAAFHCAVGFPPPQFSIQDGNVHVRP